MEVKPRNSKILRFAISENGSYLLVALFVSLILWVTLLSRKETRLIKSVPVEILVADVEQRIEDAPRSVNVEVVGPRVAVKRFQQTYETITIDIGVVSPGVRRIKVPTDGLSLPPKVSLRSISPHIISVRVVDPKK